MAGVGSILSSTLKNYGLSSTYVLSAGVGSLIALWAATNFNHPIIFTGYCAAVISIPLIVQIFTGTNGIFTWMKNNVIEATVLVGFTATIAIAVLAMISHVPPEEIGKLMLYGGGGTVVMVVLEFFKPFLDVLFAILKALFCMLKGLTDWLGINTGNTNICDGGDSGGGSSGLDKAIGAASNIFTKPVEWTNDAVAKATGSDPSTTKPYVDTGASLATWGTYDFAQHAADGNLQTRDYLELGANLATFGTYNVVKKGFGAVGLGW